MDQNYQNAYMNPTPVVKNAAYFRQKAREALRPIYLYAVLACLIASLLGGASGNVSVYYQSDVEIEVDDGIVVEGAETSYRLDNILNLIADGDWGNLLDQHPLFGVILIVMIVAICFVMCFSLFISSPVSIGYKRYLLNVVDGTRQKELGTLFLYFKNGYLKSVWLHLVYALIQFACSLPVLAASIWGIKSILSAAVSFVNGENDVFRIGVILLAVAALIAASVLSTVLRIVVGYRYFYAGMIFAEYPQTGVIDAFRQSANLMRGNKWRLFCLQFSFIGWNILAACCTFGIGFFFLSPYIHTAETAFYDDIANRVAAREAEFPSLDPSDYTVD